MKREDKSEGGKECRRKRMKETNSGGRGGIMKEAKEVESKEDNEQRR